MELTPTQFIRQAALKTGTVITPTPWKEKPPDKKIRKSMANQIEVNGHVGIVMADSDIESVKDDKCWLCGGETGGNGLPVKKAILDTFTNRDMARAPASNYVCAGCAFCLSQLNLRNYSSLATLTGLVHPTRAEIRDILISPPEPPFVLCIAVSGQKHLHFKSEISYSQDFYPVQMEETRITVNVKLLTKVLNLIERLYTVFSKDEIKTGRYSQGRMKEIGIAKFQELEDELRSHRGTRLFDLAVFVAQKQEFEEPATTLEKEEVCTITSTQMTELQQLQLF